MGEISSFNEKVEDSQNLQAVEEKGPVGSEHDGVDLMSEEEKKQNEAASLALQTKRESLKEFFLQKQPYIHKDTFTDNQTSNLNIKDESKKEKLTDENPSQESSETIKPNIIQDTSTDKLPTSPPANLELSPDEKLQKAAANRHMQRKSLRDFMKKKRLEQTSAPVKSEKIEEANDLDDTINSTLSGLNSDKKIKETEDDTINSKEDLILNGLNNSDNKINDSIYLKRSKNKTSSEDSDSDGSVDLDALIAGGGDLESGEIQIQLNDDGFDDGDDNFWRVDPEELKKHLTPSTSPLPRHSPDPHNTPSSSLARPVSIIAEEDENLSDTPLEVDGQEADDIMNSSPNSNGFDMVSKEAEYEDDEINEIDMSLDTQITPILKPVSPSPVPSPHSTLSGGKTGIPAGLSKTAFSAFIPSPLSPTSSRASSVGDPDEYETMSNGSYTSVRSTGSVKSGTSGIRRPSTTTGLRSPSRTGSQIGPSRIATPGRVDSYSSTPTPQRSRSLSYVSDSSTEESTTSSVGATSPSRIASPTRGLHMYMTQSMKSMTGGTRQRSVSRVSNSSADDVLARTSTSHIARPLSRAGGSHIAAPKSSNISTGSQSRIRNNVPSSPSNAKSKYATPNSELPKRSSSRADIAKSPSTSTTPVRSLSRLGTLSESSKASALKKPRPQSIAVGNTSNKIQSNNTAHTNSGIGVLRTPHYGGRQSADSLSSHDEHSASSMIFTPPESPTAASETDSLTSLTSSVSYGSSPGRGPSPIPSIPSAPTRLSKPGTRTSMTAVSSINKPSSRMIPSKLATPSGLPASGLRRPKVTKE